MATTPHEFTCTRCGVVASFSGDVLKKTEAWFLCFTYQFWIEFVDDDTGTIEMFCVACQKAQGLWKDANPQYIPVKDRPRRPRRGRMAHAYRR
jgi:hypothetical protein